MANLLITGGAGFIGSHFTEHWSGAHAADRVVVLDALTYAANRRHLEACEHNPNFRFVHGDINDGALVEELLRDESLDTLVHFAAESHVDRSIADPDAFIQTNIVGTHALLRAARRVWIEEGRCAAHRFHHVSTDEVYGSRAPGDAAANEASAYAPNSPYAASKAASDHLVRAYGRTYGLKVTTSSSSNNYGPRQFPEKLIPLAIRRLLEGSPIPVYGDGRQRREWIHVREHCRGIELVLTRGVAGEVYHLGGGDTVENLELVKRLCARVDAAFAADGSLATRYPRAPAARGLKSDSHIEFVADRPGHDRHYAVAGDKARHELGFHAQIALEQGLADTIGWYLANEPWWRGER